MNKVLRIAVLASWEFGYIREMLRGIKAFAQTHPSWIIHCGLPEIKIAPLLRQWRPDGILVHSFGGAMDAVHDLGVPVVVLASGGSRPVYDAVVDDHAIGVMAGRYFVGRGFQHFAYLGVEGVAWSLQREAGFRSVIQETNRPCSALRLERTLELQRMTLGWIAVDGRMQQWLRNLPKPVAIFAVNDSWGRALAEGCLQAGLHVPEEVSILGVDNDDLVCEMAQPSLSSIEVPFRKLGYAAAELLDKLLTGQKVEEQQRRFGPNHVVTRQSSDLVAVTDPDVSSVVRLIRQYADQPVTVRQIMREIPVARRSLERRFQQALGRSLLQEIHRVHIERAKQLLVTTDLPMPAIADRSGFSSAWRLSALFNRETGLTPTAYRRQFQTHSPDEDLRSRKPQN